MIVRRSLHLTVGAAALALLIGLAGEARAGSLYAYSVQETNTYVFSGGTVGLISPLSSTSTASTGSPPGSESHTGILDALQSYAGPALGRPAENTFTPIGMTTPDYARGDALMTLTPGFTTHNVAETYFTGIGNAAGSGSWAVSAPITLSAAGAVTLSFNYTNNITLAIAAASGSLAADYTYTFTIRDSLGSVVFSSSPNALNTALSLNAPGSIALPGSGTISITSGTLAAGTYTGSLQGSEHVFVNSAVPEPSSCILLGSGVVVTLVALRIRRRPAA